VGVAPFSGEDAPRFSEVLANSGLRTLRVRSWYMSNGSAEECVEDLLGAPSWGNIDSLMLGYIGFDTDRLLANPNLKQLRTLTLYRNSTAEDLADRLFTCDALAGLRALRVDVPCVSRVLETPDAAPMSNLRDLHACLPTSTALESLAVSPHFR